ncbi:glutathione synthase/RimK-type ligase-like ATP-grasp enzyme [Rhodovulum sulfidophilum]|uniref:MvdC/MvdD family ATP grasp protein n=1 Tax=Rhodovulum sulfidophilum TaxID=35806 RepID=UPI0005A8E895|nr:hypothetical protein [Rhodovulum sulfidophilum]ANB34612.1 ATP-dependent carboxylate-amine ligase [Rhodovulum sulfidophilum DSM 1374]ANB38434.1 ATP-dependent carboxylate-amine ligase [Rhodovulum sulfidophilum]MCW2305381.1 glutathione synthase/RimK-type ligase-like ATP-grasp enzyme [Rhodovulum sulfidophilum]
MILLATNKRDITSDFIVLELKRRGIEYFRLNTEDLPLADIQFEPQSGWRLKFEKSSLNLSDVRAGYFRRPGTPEIPGGIEDRGAQEYLKSEWTAVLRSLWNSMEGKWLNSPFSILRAEDKPRQLSVATDIGLKVPQTLIGNTFDAVRIFQNNTPVVGKPLRHSLIDHGPTGSVIFTHRVAPLEDQDRAAVEISPVIYQAEIEKFFDVRVTIVGARVFAVAIYSQTQLETQVDWRRGGRLDLQHEVVSLPEEISQKCLALTRCLGLQYGAIDLVCDTDGLYWFLEINPNGQWAWIERRTGSQISQAIVDTLVEISS